MPNNRITLCENALDPTSWETQECGDVREFLVEHFGAWPKTARIYLNRVARDTDVTPYDEGGVERLGSLTGHFFVVVYPEGATVILLIVAIALSAVAMAMGFLLRPSLPENQDAGSPTNSLTGRQNKERLGGRIPDIYGSLWVTPDLIGVPYRIFIGNKEVEFSYMCIGRGEYDIAEVRDDVTPIEQIDGAGCEIYAPYTSPNSGDDPQASYGEPIAEPIRNVKQYSSVNGQTLKAPNANKFKASNNVRFTDEGVVEGSGDIDFTDYFDAGTEANPNYLIIGNSSYNGTYLILDVDTTRIVLSAPGSVNAAWNSLSGETAYGSPTLLNSKDNFEGPFLIVDNTVNELWANFVAAQGLYEVDSDGNQHAMSVTVQLEITSIDNNYNPQGSPIYYQTTLKGSEVLRTQCGATLVVHLPIAGSCRVRARRLTNTDLRDGWNVVDQIQWRDLYGVAPLTETDFGNITTIQTITWPTPQALSIKQRKINVLIGRKIPVYQQAIEGYTPTAGLGGVIGAFCDDDGNVIHPFEIGYGGTFRVPYGATTLQVGVNDDTFYDNSGTGFPITVSKGEESWSGTVTNKAMPWDCAGSKNAAYHYGIHDGSAPIVVPITLQFDDEIIITCLNGQIDVHSPLFPTTSPVGYGNGANPTTTEAGSTGQYFPTKYMLVDGTPGGMTTFNLVSSNAADILIEMALDPYIGRRQDSEVDIETIKDVLRNGGESSLYFGTDLCCQFSYAFDDTKISFEEMVAQLAQATFCTAYRRGNVLTVKLERQTDDSTILFNHRNKIPGSETRTVKFGTASENDGIDLDYIEPNAPNAQNIDSVVTLRFPTEGSPALVAVAPKKIKAIGVRNRVQAWMLGWRLYNKLLYQNTATQFEATSEAGLCVNNERILVADNTRPDIQDGEVLAQDGLEITLSQPAVFASPSPNYTIYLQHYDGTVEAIPIEPGSAENKVVLAEAPSMALVLDSAKFARTTYMIVSDTDQAASAFLLQEKDAKDGGQYGIKAINYDDRYYAHDQDYNASPRLIDEITPGDGTGAGYSAQASASVYVSGKTRPWIAADNPTKPYGIGDGKPPVAVPLQATEGETIAIAASAPGQIIQIWNLQYATNMVWASGNHAMVDADGEDGQITGQTLDSGDGWSNKRFPTYYATSPALGHCCLMGAFAKLNAGKYEVIEVLAIGFGGNYTVPAGGVTHLLLGINDTKFSDNGGGFQVQVTQTGTAAGAAAAADPTPDTTTSDPNVTTYIFTANGE
jgi:hypothetical protein